MGFEKVVIVWAIIKQPFNHSEQSIGFTGRHFLPTDPLPEVFPRKVCLVCFSVQLWSDIRELSAGFFNKKIKTSVSRHDAAKLVIVAVKSGEFDPSRKILDSLGRQNQSAILTVASTFVTFLFEKLDNSVKTVFFRESSLESIRSWLDENIFFLVRIKRESQHFQN